LDDADFDAAKCGAAALVETGLPVEALGEAVRADVGLADAAFGDAECEAVLLWPDGVAARQGATMMARPTKIPVI
jgi:hypothetical protein